MGQVKYATGIDYVKGSLAKPKVKDGHSCGTYLIGTHRNAPTENPKCARLYVREADTYKRTTPLSDNELAARARFTAVQAAVKTRANDLSKIATPLALFTLGGAIQFASAKAHLKQLRIVVPFKLFISPLIFMAVCIACGMRGVALACAFIAFGAPTAVSSYPMAQQMGGDGELAAECVAFTSTLCIFSTFLFVFGMKATGLI